MSRRKKVGISSKKRCFRWHCVNTLFCKSCSFVHRCRKLLFWARTNSIKQSWNCNYMSYYTLNWNSIAVNELKNNYQISAKGFNALKINLTLNGNNCLEACFIKSEEKYDKSNFKCYIMYSQKFKIISFFHNSSNGFFFPYFLMQMHQFKK